MQMMVQLLLLLQMQRRRLMLMLLLLQLLLVVRLLLLVLLLKLMLAYVTIHFRVLPRRVDWRHNGGIQFPLLLIFQLSHQLRMLPDGPLVLVVLVVGVRWRWRVGHIGLGRVQRVGTPSCPRSGTSCCGHCCCSSGTHRTGHNGRLVEMRRSGTRPGLITGCQGVEERRCRAIYKMPMYVMLDAALAQLLMLRGQNHVPQGAVLVDNLLHHMARWNLHRHRYWGGTIL